MVQEQSPFPKTSVLRVRELGVNELALCVPYGQAFHREFGLPGSFLSHVFVHNWETFFERYSGTIFGLWDDRTLVGGLGAIIVPDLSDGRLCAQEMFWFVDPAYRSNLGGIRLLKAFLAWAHTHTTEARIVHMENGITDEQLDRVYRKFGFRPIERCYLLRFTKE